MKVHRDVILIAVCCVFGFGSNVKALTPVRVVSPPVLSSAGIYLAISKKFFFDLGLDVKLTELTSSGSSIATEMASGKYDVSASNLSAHLLKAILGGNPLRLAADKGHIANTGTSLIVRKDLIESKKFKTMKDLAGLRIGLTALNGVPQQILISKILESAGLKEKDVKFVTLTYSQMNEALKSKTLDATIQTEPYLAMAKLSGLAEEVEPASKVDMNQQFAAILYRPSFVTENRETAVRFMVGYLRGVRLYNQSLTNPVTRKEVNAILKEFLKIQDDNVFNVMGSVGLNDSGELNWQSISEEIKWYKKSGIIRNKMRPSEEQIIDKTILSEAQARLSKY